MDSETHGQRVRRPRRLSGLWFTTKNVAYNGNSLPGLGMTIARRSRPTGRTGAAAIRTRRRGSGPRTPSSGRRRSRRSRGALRPRCSPTRRCGGCAPTTIHPARPTRGTTTCFPSTTATTVSTWPRSPGTSATSSVSRSARSSPSTNPPRPSGRRRTDVRLDGKVLRASFAAGQVQTFQLDQVSV